MKQYHYYTLLICVLIVSKIIPIKVQLWIWPFSLLLFKCESCGLLTEEESSRQMPQPDLSALKDDTGETQLSDEFLPAVMIALHYYTDMMQYQKVENAMITQKPTTVKSTTTTTTTTTRRQTTKTTTTRPITRSTTTTRRPTPTTRRTTTSVTQRTTPTTRRSTTTKPQYRINNFFLLNFAFHIFTRKKNCFIFFLKKICRLSTTTHAWRLCSRETNLLYVL